MDPDVEPPGATIKRPRDRGEGILAVGDDERDAPFQSGHRVVQLPPVFSSQNLVPKRSPRAVQMAA
jgi:hypothetical protein